MTIAEQSATTDVSTPQTMSKTDFVWHVINSSTNQHPKNLVFFICKHPASGRDVECRKPFFEVKKGRLFQLHLDAYGPPLIAVLTDVERQVDMGDSLFKDFLEKTHIEVLIRAVETLPKGVSAPEKVGEVMFDKTRELALDLDTSEKRVQDFEKRNAVLLDQLKKQKRRGGFGMIAVAALGVAAIGGVATYYEGKIDAAAQVNLSNKDLGSSYSSNPPLPAAAPRALPSTPPSAASVEREGVRAP